MKTMKIMKEKLWKALVPAEINQNDISFFDVKELYDSAFAAKDQGRVKRFNALLAQAEAMDAAYRQQLAMRKAGPAGLYGKAA